MGRSKGKKAKGLSAAEIAKLERDKIDYQMEKLPPLQFSDIFGNSTQAFDSLFGKAGTALNGMVDSGYQAFANNPMQQLVSMLAGDRMGDMGGELQQTEPVAPIQTPAPAPEPELSPYEARIQQLMKNRGWSREEAVINQKGALERGTDYNNDGAVTNDEWRKYKNPQQGGAGLLQVQPTQNQVRRGPRGRRP